MRIGGLFTDDGQIMARVINNHAKSWLDGTAVLSGGIGAVSTLPEYRNSGAVREIFHHLLPEAYRRGEVISTLYPFLHGFYRKFGYETICYANQFQMTPAQLAGYSHDGWVRQWKPGDDVTPYTEIYNAFAAGYNLSHLRDNAGMAREHICGRFYKDRHFVYLLGTGDKACAYVDFQDEYDPKAARLIVKEAAWTGPEGFRSVLGFLARFTADYGFLEIPLPTDMDLRMLVRNPYEVTENPLCGHMVRLINAEKVLALIKKPSGAAFTIAVRGDEQIRENNGVFRVEGESVVRTDGTPDLTVSVQALGQLAVGAVSLAEAEYRPDVEVTANRETLAGVFRRKPIYIGDHFLMSHPKLHRST
jgi:Predicted acetyltransferase involved in intracellular survival and related acetyltransferases